MSSKVEVHELIKESQVIQVTAFIEVVGGGGVSGVSGVSGEAEESWDERC